MYYEKHQDYQAAVEDMIDYLNDINAPSKDIEYAEHLWEEIFNLQFLEVGEDDEAFRGIMTKLEKDGSEVARCAIDFLKQAE